MKSATFKRVWPYLVLIATSLVFFIFYLFLYIFPGVNSLPAVKVDGRIEPGILILNQPDESINYLFIRERVLHNRSYIPESLSPVVNNQIHPRSTTVVHGNIVPIGFPGLIMLYSFVLTFFVHIFGLGIFNTVAVSLTPLLGALTPIIFFAWLKQIFGQKIALVSALLLYILPPWWYYASRPFQHGTAFIFFLIFGLYALAKFRNNRTDWERIIWIFIAGQTLAFSLYLRPVEAVWVLAIVIVYLIAYCRKIRPIEIITLLLAAGMIAGLFFATQTLFYGNAFASGYIKPAADGSAGLISNGSAGINLVRALILPFGFHPWALLRTGYHYLIQLFAPWFVLAAVGLIFVLLRKKHRHFFVETHISQEENLLHYVIVLACLTMYLLMYYGSWMFFDNLAHVYSIGSSQIRYFLPIYIFALPLLAYALLAIKKLSSTGPLIVLVIVLTFVAASIRSVFLRFEGLTTIKSTVANYYYRREQIDRVIPREAIVVSRYADKYLYPGHRVITDWSDDSLEAAQKLVKLGFPVYWYDLDPRFGATGEMRPEVSDVFARHSLVLSGQVLTWDDLWLYRLFIKPPIEDKPKK